MMNIQEITNSQEINACREIMGTSPWWERGENERCFFIGLMQERRVIGFVAIEICQDTGFIHHFFVESRYRGTRAWQRLWTGVQEFAQKLRLKRLTGTIATGNAQAHRIAAKLGFETHAFVVSKEVR